jgi:hypothetical protein
MPTGTKQKQTQKRLFLYGQVTGEFVSVRTYGTEMEVLDLTNEIEKALGEDHSSRLFIGMFAEAFVYTQTCAFDWHEAVPSEIRNFEKFWGMVENGTPPLECFQYFADNIANFVLSLREDKTKQVKTPWRNEIGWHEAMRGAQEVWAPPPEWKMEDELTEAERTDPN